MFCCISRIRTADSQILACSILPIDLTWIIYKSHKDTPSLVTPSAADEGKFTAATTSIGGKRRRSFEERIFLFISSILREFDLRLKSILFLRRLAPLSRGQVFSLSSMVRLRSPPHDGTILEGNW